MAVSRGRPRKNTSKRPAPSTPKRESSKRESKGQQQSFFRRVVVGRRAPATVSTHPEFNDSWGFRWIPILTGLLGLLLLFTVYQLGRAETNCARNYESIIGTVKYVPAMVPKSDVSESLFAFVPSVAKVRKPSDLQQEERLLLVDPQGNALTVNHDQSVDLRQYDNKNVILTGDYSPCKKTITLDTVKNVLPLFAPATQTPTVPATPTPEEQ